MLAQILDDLTQWQSIRVVFGNTPLPGERGIGFSNSPGGLFFGRVCRVRAIGSGKKHRQQTLDEHRVQEFHNRFFTCYTSARPESRKLSTEILAEPAAGLPLDNNGGAHGIMPTFHAVDRQPAVRYRVFRNRATQTQVIVANSRGDLLEWLAFGVGVNQIAISAFPAAQIAQGTAR